MDAVIVIGGMNKMHIKSEGLCERCKYGAHNDCKEMRCIDCPLQIGSRPDGGAACVCTSIKKGSPCKYYQPL